MARCPFAVWDEITGDSGGFSKGPYKIVHHTTELDTYAKCRTAYKNKKADPHFTVDGTQIYQHVETDRSSRALRNPPGGVETNHWSAISIELVAKAGQDKDAEVLKNTAKLCRWLEEQYGIPQAWPSGHPKPPRNGKDPGGHNRDVDNWTNKGGHYGHSQVPENDHWDPAYTEEEVKIITPDEVV